MDNKYYTPSITEFHVGFEYEFLEDHGSPDERWVAKKIGEYDFTDGEDDPYKGNTLVSLYKYDQVYLRNAWRVKYLDREDIESLGWTYRCRLDGGCENKFYQDRYELSQNVDRFTLEVSSEYHVGISRWRMADPRKPITSTVFSGRVRNKSELLRLMTQIGVI